MKWTRLGLIFDPTRHALANNCQFVLLGTSPDAKINEDFWGLKRHLNDSPDCHLELSYDDYLAHLIYAGADMILVPSAFEPCGLTQLIAMNCACMSVGNAGYGEVRMLTALSRCGATSSIASPSAATWQPASRSFCSTDST